MFSRLFFALLITGGFAGCGSQGPARYEIRGNVTLESRPVPSGRIIFEPDPTKDNRGPAAYGTVKDGYYQISADKGHVGGPHVVRIQATDLAAIPELQQVEPLFPDYRTTIDLPKGKASQDFEVPPPGR